MVKKSCICDSRNIENVCETKTQRFESEKSAVCSRRTIIEFRQNHQITQGRTNICLGMFAVEENIFLDFMRAFQSSLKFCQISFEV